MGIFPHALKKTVLLVFLASAVTTVLVLFGIHKIPWPRCPFEHYLQFDCPMCGTSHAVMQFYMGNIAQSFSANPFWPLWVFWSVLAFIDLWHKVFSSGTTIGTRTMQYAMQHPLLGKAHLACSALALVYRNW